MKNHKQWINQNKVVLLRALADSYWASEQLVNQLKIRPNWENHIAEIKAHMERCNEASGQLHDLFPF